MTSVGVDMSVVDAGFEPVGDFSANNCAGWPQPSVFVQWKGTDVCMDFHCECGAFCHFDGFFAYTVQCPHCKTVWEMPSKIYPRKVSEKTFTHWRDNPKILERDEEFVVGDEAVEVEQHA